MYVCLIKENVPSWTLRIFNFIFLEYIQLRKTDLHILV